MEEHNGSARQQQHRGAQRVPQPVRHRRPDDQVAGEALLRFPHQPRRRRRSRARHLGGPALADRWPEGRRAQRPGRHLGRADRGRCAHRDAQHPAAHARPVGPGLQRRWAERRGQGQHPVGDHPAQVRAEPHRRHHDLQRQEAARRQLLGAVPGGRERRETIAFAIGTTLAWAPRAWASPVSTSPAPASHHRRRRRRQGLHGRRRRGRGRHRHEPPPGLQHRHGWLVLRGPQRHGHLGGKTLDLASVDYTGRRHRAPARGQAGDRRRPRWATTTCSPALGHDADSRATRRG